MRHLFLLRSLSHRVVVIDITAVDPRWEASEGFTGRSAPAAVYRNWASPEAYFRLLGADDAAIDQAPAS